MSTLEDFCEFAKEYRWLFAILAAMLLLVHLYIAHLYFTGNADEAVECLIAFWAQCAMWAMISFAVFSLTDR